jgi:purine-nucleoside phosphorylase
VFYRRLPVRTFCGVLTIFIPSDYEAAEFIALMKDSRVCRCSKERIAGVPVYTGAFDGGAPEKKNSPVRIAICGMGQPNSATRIGAVLDALAPLNEREPVWLVGFGGGLDPSLKRYEMVWLDGGVGAGNAAGIETAASAPVRAASIVSGLPARRIAKIFTSDVVVDTPERKVAAFNETGAEIVDMETGPFIELLAKHGRTGAVIRVISDDVTDEFPADLIGHTYDFAKGRNTPFRLAWRLLTHPRDIGRMRHFLAPLPKARKILTRFVTAAAFSAPSGEEIFQTRA